VFLTFHGERRHDAPAPADAHGGHDTHGHGGHGHGHGAPHDAPPAMALALVVLAIGSVLAGYVGIPAALGGHNALGAWLAPSFAAPVEPGAVAEAAAEGEEVHDAEHIALERTLMGVSSGIAVGGLLLAAFIWLKRREIADQMARSFAPIYQLLLNKYYVDEIYDATVVKPVQAVSREGLWRGVDVGIIDGAVNGVGAIVDASSMMLRRLQTGSVRAYAGSLFIGVVLMLGYYLWR
jgi:NADH-quinone oxidoreductase subunit L